MQRCAEYDRQRAEVRCSSPCLPATGCAPSPWPPQPGFVSRMAKLQSATAVTNLCWNQLVDMLQGRHLAGGSCIQWRGGLRPTAFECRELQPGTLELQPATGGAARGVAIFAEQFSFCWNRCIVFLEPR